MPELPEVQTIVSDLNTKLKGHRIQKVWTDWPKSFHPSVLMVKRGIVGKLMIRVRRRAKNILIDFENDKTLLIHLKMTGHLLYRDREWRKTADKESPFHDSFNQFIRTLFFLDNNMELAFSDVRRFGEIKLFKTTEENDIPRFKKLGPEPLSREFTFDVFKTRLRNKKGSIKSVLLDQNVIAGIGNIYADEILWEAKINPKQKTNLLSPAQLKTLHKAIVKVLTIAVKNRGTSISDYRDALGRKGNYQKIRKVYKRDKQECYRCGNKLSRTIVNNRGTTFCSKCQKINV